jgi:hypothetical protein
MTASEAIHYMEGTGECVKYTIDLKPLLNRHFRLFRNKMICELIPDVAVAARVTMQYDYDGFLADGHLVEFEPYQGAYLQDSDARL